MYTTRSAGCIRSGGIVGGGGYIPISLDESPVFGYIACVSGYIPRKVINLLAANFSI